jgi:prevent-host-death family protein
MRRVALAEIKDQLSKYLRDARKEEILITRHGKPAGVLVGFESEDDWFDYRLENDPRFLSRVDAARRALRGGRGVKLEDLGARGKAQPNPRLERTGRTVRRGRAARAAGRSTAGR